MSDKKYPELTNPGSQAAQALIDKFKVELHKAAEPIIEKIIRDMYCDIVPHIESDSWTNYRNS